MCVCAFMTPYISPTQGGRPRACQRTLTERKSVPELWRNKGQERGLPGPEQAFPFSASRMIGEPLGAVSLSQEAGSCQGLLFPPLASPPVHGQVCVTDRRPNSNREVCWEVGKGHLTCVVYKVLQLVCPSLTPQTDFHECTRFQVANVRLAWIGRHCPKPVPSTPVPS